MNKITLINTSASKMAKNEGISMWIKNSNHVYYKTVQNLNTLPIDNNSVVRYEFFAALALRSKSMILIKRSKNKIARKVNIDLLVTFDRGNWFV